MLNSICAKYYPSISPLHSIHPFLKLLSLLLFIVLSWISDDLWFHLLLIGFSCLLIFESHVPYRIYWKPIWGMKYFFLFLFIINLCFGVSWTMNIVMMLRLIEILIYTTMITLTTKTMSLIHGLEMIMSPLKLIRVPVSSIAMIITLALQFIPNITEQANKILKSLASRGLDYEVASLREKWKILKAVVIPMFLLSFKRADHLAEAMELRHYNPEEARTRLEVDCYHRHDLYFLILHILLFCILIGKEVFLCVI